MWRVGARAVPTRSPPAATLRWRRKLGQPVVVTVRRITDLCMQNDAFARAQNDGYTLGIMTAGQIIAAVMNKSLRWRSEQDFTRSTSDGGRERVVTPFLSVLHSGARIRRALMRATLVRQRGRSGKTTQRRIYQSYGS
jgi:hypothetical protein